MNLMKSMIATSLVFAACLSCAAAAPSGLAVGWHDELNDIVHWKSLPHDNTVDAFASRPGALMMRMRATGPNFGAAYQWGGVMRIATVDLKRFPALVARVTGLQSGSYAHLSVAELDTNGNVTPSRGPGRSPTLWKPGLTAVDLADAGMAETATSRLRIRLIVGGSLKGVAAEYAWVRFVRRDDAKRLLAGWDPQEITEVASVELPTGSPLLR